MASDNNNWIAETVGDFIHSPIWAAPIHTFIEANCATFDYDDDDNDPDENNQESSSSVEEQIHLHKNYQRLVDSLITGLGKDLGLDQNELTKICQLPTPLNDADLVDERYEQLYSARDFELFQNMMRRKNLILQLQALISLQMQWGILKQGDTRDDIILSLLLQATTSSSSRRGSTNSPQESIPNPIIKQQVQKEEHKVKYNDVDDDDDDDVVVVPKKEPSSTSSRKSKPKAEPKKPPKEEYRLPNLRHKGAQDLDAQWHRDLRQQDSKSDDDSVENDQSKNEFPPQTIGAIPEKLLRQKLRDLTERTTSRVDDKTAAAMEERKKFLQEQREKIVNEKRVERAQELEQQTPHVRPQSAAHIARKAMNTPNENKQEQIPDDELIKRRAMMAKLKREVVDKR